MVLMTNIMYSYGSGSPGNPKQLSWTACLTLRKMQGLRKWDTELVRSDGTGQKKGVSMGWCNWGDLRTSSVLGRKRIPQSVEDFSFFSESLSVLPSLLRELDTPQAPRILLPCHSHFPLSILSGSAVSPPLLHTTAGFSHKQKSEKGSPLHFIFSFCRALQCEDLGSC